jgi:RHS repeat-associated protein
LETLTDPLSRVVEFEYDGAGRLTRQLLPDSTEIEYGYDRNGNLVSLTPPGRPAHTFGYTPVNLMADYTAPDIGGDSTATRYTWNADRQLTRIARPDGRDVDIGYDAAGRPDSLGFSRGGLFFTYSGTTGNLTGIAAPGGNTLAYTYDGSLLTRVEWDGEVEGSVEVGYDNDFRVVKQKVNDTDSVTFQYDDDGLLTGAGALSLTRDTANGLLTGTTLDSVTTSLSYNGFGELSGMSTAFSASTLFQTTYTRDDLGRITRIIETVQGVTDTIDYAYDPVGRLEEVTRNGVIVENYTYDANGNRTSFTGTSGTINATYDDQDRLLTYGSTSYTYTAAGELSQKVEGTDTTRYEYDEFGNLVEVELPDGTLIEYVIDGQHRRIGRKVNGSLVQAFVYGDQLNPVAELDSLGSIVAHFVLGERINVPDFTVKSGVAYRIITDHLGSVRLVVEASTGQVVQSIRYDSFGQVIQNTNPAFQPFAFAGGLLDDETRLLRFGARDYAPDIGRWQAKDPLYFEAGGTNLAEYVSGDPVNAVDPAGLCPWCVAGFLGGATDLAFQLILNGFDVTCLDWSQAFRAAFFSAAGAGLAQRFAKVSTVLKGEKRPTYRYLKRGGIRLESHPPGDRYPNWFSYPHWHPDFAGRPFKKWHWPLIEPLVAMAAIAQGSTCCE